MNREGNAYTFIFSTVMVVVAAAALAVAATALKPYQQANIKKEKMQYIMRSIGMHDITRDASPEAYHTYIKDTLVLDDNGKEIGKGAFVIDLAKDKGKHPVFIADKDGQRYYVLPVRGMGLWDVIWGYVAVDQNLTVKGIVFDHKGETPGLGAEITHEYFQNRFIGENIFAQTGSFQGLKVVKGYKGGEDKIDGQVDAISGSTLTCNGVSSMLFNGLEPYANYLQSIKK